ncbi:MAG: DinB family protein [Dehalococcoidia bacterium]
MNRIEIEVKLNTARARLLEKCAAMAEEDLTRGITPSEHDPSSSWSAKDHLAHLAGIEKNFNRMIRRHLDGVVDPVGLRNNADGTPRSREQIMAGVHAMTEAWVLQHRDMSLSGVVALGERVRSETLALLADLTDAQLTQTLPGAPWADGTIGGVLAVNADHGGRHMQWVDEGLVSRR